MPQMIFRKSRSNICRILVSIGLLIALMLDIPFAQVRAQTPGASSVKAAEQAATDAANRLDFEAMEKFAQIACDGGSDNGCRMLLGRYDSGLHYVPNNPQPWSMGKSQPIRAAAVLQILCDRNKASDCRELARRLSRRSNALTTDYIRAAKLHKKACDLDSSESCYDGGKMYADGRDVANDPIAATLMLEKACQLGRDSNRCEFLANSYAEGRGVAKDDMAATRVYRRACEGFGEFGSKTACFELGQSYALGRGTAKDAASALLFLNKACDSRIGRACDVLGSAYADNTIAGIAQDPKRAYGYFRRACDMEDPKGCYNDAVRAAGGIGTPRDMERAVAAYRASCGGKEGVAQSCINLAQIVTDGKSGKLDLPLARSALLSAERFQPTAEQKVLIKTQFAALNDRLCDNGDAVSCLIRGSDYASGNGVPKDEGRAATLFQKACNGGRIEGCLNEGLMLIRAGTLPADHVRAAALFRRACDDKQASGCYYLGALYANGTGVVANNATAISLMKQAHGMYPTPDLEKRITAALTTLQK